MQEHLAVDAVRRVTSMTAAVLYCSEGIGKFSLEEGILIREFTTSSVSRAIN